MKTSCYHHKTVARPPREARKPPSLRVVTDKRDDAVRTDAQVCCCHWFCFVGPQVCALLNRGKCKGAAWPESGRVSEGRGLGQQDCRR